MFSLFIQMITSDFIIIPVHCLLIDRNYPDYLKNLQTETIVWKAYLLLPYDAHNTGQ